MTTIKDQEAKQRNRDKKERERLEANASRKAPDLKVLTRQQDWAARKPWRVRHSEKRGQAVLNAERNGPAADRQRAAGEAKARRRFAEKFRLSELAAAAR